MRSIWFTHFILAELGLKAHIQVTEILLTVDYDANSSFEDFFHHLDDEISPGYFFRGPTWRSKGYLAKTNQENIYNSVFVLEIWSLQSTQCNITPKIKLCFPCRSCLSNFHVSFLFPAARDIGVENLSNSPAVPAETPQISYSFTTGAE